MSKRIKSFLMTLASIAVASLGVIIFTPEFSNAVSWIAHTSEMTLLGWGVPGVIVIVLGKFVDEVWRNLLNKHIAKTNGYGKIGSAQGAGPDLY